MQNAGRALKCLCGAHSSPQPPLQGAWEKKGFGYLSPPCILIVQIPRRFIYWDRMDLFCHCLASPCPHTLVRQPVLTPEPLHFCLQTNYISRKSQASLWEGEKQQAVLFCNNKSLAMLQKSSGHKWFPCFLHAKHTNPPAKLSPHHEIQFQLETRILPSKSGPGCYDITSGWEDAMTSSLAKKMGGLNLLSDFYWGSYTCPALSLLWVPWSVVLSLMFATEVIFLFKTLLWGAETRNKKNHFI